jgi:hypothetical protein
MSNSQKSVVDPVVDVSNVNPSGSQKCCSLINILTVLLLVVVGWFGFMRAYLGSLESQVVSTMNAVHNVVPASEFRALQQSIESLSFKINELEKQSISTQEIRLQIQAIESKLKEVASEKQRESSSAKENQEWKTSLVDAIEMGRPLATLRENSVIPEKIREQMMGVDFIPTHKNISETWSTIRSSIKFKEVSVQTNIKVSPGWWDGFKMFLKSIFKVQRLTKDNLTQEEVLVRDVDRLLMEKDIDALVQQLSHYMDRFDATSECQVKEWIKKLDIFRKGQLIINMVKV